MNINLVRDKAQRQGGRQTAYLAVGDHTDLENWISVVIHVTHDGLVELDIGETDVRRLRFGDAEAEALAHVFARMPHAELGANIANALLDAAHIARQQLGRESARTPLESLFPQKSPVEVT